MKAIEICFNTKKLVDNKGEIYGHIHSVFNRVCNIVTKDNLLIPVISTNIPNTPRSISLSLPTKNTIGSLGLKRGMEVIIKNNMLSTVEGDFKLDLSNAKVWDSRPSFDFKKVSEAQLLKNLDYLLQTFLKEGNFAGIAPVSQELAGIVLDKAERNAVIKAFREKPLENNHYSSFIFHRLLKLIDAYNLCNTDLIKSCARQIVGFGPGLTPSADDFLAGFMVANIYLADYHGQSLGEIFTLNNSVVEDAESRTTKVSSEMLYFAARGEVSDNIRALMLSLFSADNQYGLLNNIHSVINNGETSGSDLIAGIYIGCILSMYK